MALALALGSVIQGSRTLEQRPVFSALFVASASTLSVLVPVAFNWSAFWSSEDVAIDLLIIVPILATAWTFVPVARRVRRLIAEHPDDAEAMLTACRGRKRACPR